ncbi:Eukaryotic peptide chain release factor GTP-binding subunit [Pleurotus ostreatus]|uniref:Palmitoyltransferase n=1 Tax=Pleurotus ostreatus TaxID=5322 RepID=A0A8H7DZU4_PLEOS|nr:Eukaryotic peptide chain release factor GTP-binding subunit [Pleurotus ostreatus]KAF7440631.1 Eukaryotic peptide chain release factor GTP-binding subunit [Pleurotus ostreatus]
MATSHSFLPDHLTAATPKRVASPPPQLPLPQSLTGTSGSAPSSPRQSTNAATALNRHSNHFITSLPPSPRTLPSDSQPFSSYLPSNAMQHAGSTHAGGIQPSAAFFRPARPDQQQHRYSVTESLYRSSQDVHTADGYQLGDLATKRLSTSSSDAGQPDSTVEGLGQMQFSTLKRLKQSREPLLPIAGKPSQSAAPRISMSEEQAGRGSKVRSSLERVFSLRRGMSFESIRKSTSSRPAASEGRQTFEGKLPDEERGFYPPPRGKQSVSPGTFGHSFNPSPSISPDPSFFPIPPQRDPPLYDTPILDPVSGKPSRNYQRHPSRNRFFLRGRLLTGGDSPWAFVASFTLLLTVGGVWLGTTCVYWWQNQSPALAAVGIYLTLVSITTMLSTAFTDPGILPRNLDLDPPYPATSPSDGGVRAPMPRDLKVRSDVVRVKYCPTCKIYRPPRSSHCKMCDNCVDGCDHHCQWVNNCVGRRNYTSFFALLLSATLTLILIIVTSALHLWWLTQREHLDFRHALNRGAGSAVVFCLSIAIIWPVAALLSYHLRLLLLNITTIEQIRNQAHKTLVPDVAPPNPFTHGSWRRNFVAILCRPAGYSWLNGPGIATEDKRDINPGLDGEGVWDGPRTS